MKGFSLIEVMISLIILSFMMLGTYTMVDNSQRAKDSVTVEDSTLLQVQMALNRFEADFSQIYSPRYFASKQNKKKKELPSLDMYNATEQFPELSKDGHPVPLLEQVDDNTLSFMTSSNRRKMQDIKQSRWTWVQYTLEDSDSSNVWVRRSSASDPFSPRVDWDKVRPQVLVKKVKEIQFSFWDVRNKDWVESLSEVAENLYAVKIDLVWLDANDGEQSNTRVFRVLWPHPNFFYNLLEGVQ